MATTQYQCTVCKRTRQTVDNDKGLTITTKCTITQGCRGSLIVVKRLPNSSREMKPDAVDNLVDWQQRNILHTHTQTITALKWRFAHPLNVPFIVDVLVRTETGERELKHDEFEVDYTEQNLVTVTFPEMCRGTAQLLARNGSKRKVYEAVNDDEIVQITRDGRLIFLDSTSDLTAGTAVLQVELVSPDGTAYQGDQLITIDGLSRTSWQTRGVMFNDIAQMKVFNLRLNELFIVPAIGTIPDGSRLNVLQVFGRAPKRHEVLLALVHDATRTDPFNRDKAHVVDVSTLANGIILRRGEAFVYRSDIETISPPLRILE